MGDEAFRGDPDAGRAAWDPTRSLENQDDWNAHAAFMNALAAESFVVLGGPLDGTPDVLLIVRAENPAEIADRPEARSLDRAGSPAHQPRRTVDPAARRAPVGGKHPGVE
jgi:hypothetical protein